LETVLRVKSSLA